MAATLGKRYGAWFQQTMLRIKDPKVSVPFYEKHFGMKLVHKYEFPEYKFDLYFMEIPTPGVTVPAPGTLESEKYLWSTKNCTLELTHNYGTESQEDFKVNNGNVEPYRGFGHVAFNTPDVYKASEKLVAAGVNFQKKPDEGRMKGLAFALDPDGYWLEIVQRSEAAPATWPEFNLSQTMLRVKDAKKSVAYYQEVFGMKLVRASHYGDFSLYFLACDDNPDAPDPESQEARDYVKTLWSPVLELTHNHGTEDDADFSYHDGNLQDKEKGILQGFGHIGFVVDDLDKFCGEMEADGRKFKKKPSDGNMKNIAFALDPDNYWVEIVQKGSSLPDNFPK